ncbi:class I SAM-dependent methyltransferase [Chloroflexota bacterium]
MDGEKSNLDFRLMSLKFRLRDLLLPRKRILEEAGIKAGFSVLDFGCGPGGYLPPLSAMVGETGRIYALDVNPLAIGIVKKLVARKRLKNVETILSGGDTGLPDASIDIVLLYDVFHGLSQPDRILAEINRVLKPEGVLSFNDHHMQDEEITSRLSEGGFFKLLKKAKSVHNFTRIDRGKTDA